MASVQEKFDSTVAELQATVEEYNNAAKVMEVAKEKAIALQGAAQTLRELLDSEADSEVVTTEAE
tara:strand:+ start:488 stop:682 length:195 start_codon:yes stop_codon:yes gene_type:complete